jgi:Na+-driven multidrug efflux pump
MYTIAYARIGTESIAAVNIAASVERMGFVVFFGLSYACAIMIGNRIGAGEEDTAYDYGRRFLVLGVSGAILVGIAILVTSPAVLSFYNISNEAYQNARGVLVVLGLVLWVKVSNMFLIVGILRSGGDTRYSFLVDVIPLWLVGVPLAFAGALVFHLPVYWTVVLATTEEFIKFGLVLHRFFSRRWIHNLVQEPA